MNSLKNNYKGYALRYEGRNEQLREGDIIDIGCHWSYEEGDPECCDSGEYIYRFECNNAEGHKIDYTKLDEDDTDNYDDEYAKICDSLGINAECYEEKEVVVIAKMFKVVYVWDRERDEYTGGWLPQTIEVEMI